MVTGFGIGIDFTGALLLIPTIQAELNADITTTQWVLNIYALFFAMLMVTGGRLGDIYGHRPVLMIGLVIFLLASLICYVAPTIGVLIAARALQGVGAGLIWPCMLAFGAVAIAAEKERGLVIGLILGGVTCGNTIGPMISGVVIEFGEWRLFFLVNVVLAVVSIIALRLLLPIHKSPVSGERIDLPGVVLLSVSILCLLYALDVGTDLGWRSLPILALFSTSALFLLIFRVVERHVRDPLVHPELMRNRQFVITLFLSCLQMPTIFIGFLYFPQYLQRSLEWSPFEAALGLAPLTALLAAGSVISGTMYKTFGPKRLLTSGYVLVALGAMSIPLLPNDLGYLQILPAMIIAGIGATLCVGSSGTASVSAVSPDQAGLAGGLSFMAHLLYGAMMVAVATVIMAVVTTSELDHRLYDLRIHMSPADIGVIS
ncbi:MAG: MFS transporter, partial [Pseudomonadota bacterium]